MKVIEGVKVRFAENCQEFVFELRAPQLPAERKKGELSNEGNVWLFSFFNKR